MKLLLRIGGIISGFCVLVSSVITVVARVLAGDIPIATHYLPVAWFREYSPFSEETIDFVHRTRVAERQQKHIPPTKPASPVWVLGATGWVSLDIDFTDP